MRLEEGEGVLLFRDTNHWNSHMIKVNSVFYLQGRSTQLSEICGCFTDTVVVAVWALRAQSVKSPPTMQETWLQPCGKF